MSQHIQFEGKKDAVRQNQDGLMKITFSIHPSDVDPRLLLAPMGKIYQVVLVDPDDIEKQPESPPAKKQLSKSQMAALVSDNPLWNQYVEQAYPDMTERGADAMRKLCGVTSRSEIKPGTQAENVFDKILDSFNIFRDYGVI